MLTSTVEQSRSPYLHTCIPALLGLPPISSRIPSFSVTTEHQAESPVSHSRSSPAICSRLGSTQTSIAVSQSVVSHRFLHLYSLFMLEIYSSSEMTGGRVSFPLKRRWAPPLSLILTPISDSEGEAQALGAPFLSVTSLSMVVVDHCKTLVQTFSSFTE